MKSLICTLVCLASIVGASFATAEETVGKWSIGYREPMGGFYLESPDENFRLGILAYVQATQKYYESSSYGSPRAVDYPLSFAIRRARIDVTTVMYKNYDLFLEFDAAPALSATTGVALVEGRATLKIFDDYLKLRVGKFLTPFSPENFKSSRAIDTVERDMVLNAMFGLPGLDTQVGAMLMGTAFDAKFNWYFAVLNGNAKPTANIYENDNNKEFQLKVTYRVIPELTLGFGFDFDAEPTQSLIVKDLAGSEFVQVPVSGNRFGICPDFNFLLGPFSTRAEFISMNWPNLQTTLSGGLFQIGYFVTGNELGGMQPILRGEIVRLDNLSLTGGHQLTSVIAGYQWFINAQVRHQLNVIGTFADGPGDGNGAYGSSSGTLAVLSEVQVGF